MPLTPLLPPTWLLHLLLFTAPALPASLVCLAVFRPARRWVAALAPWAAVPALLLAALKLLDPLATIAVGWAGFATGLRLELDPLGGAFLLLTALLWVTAGWFARGYHADDPARERFFAFFALTMAGNLGVVLAGDLLSFYLSFAVMTFAAYGLVVHDRGDAVMRAGRIYLILALAGEGAILGGIFALGAAGGGAVGFGAELAVAWAVLAEGGGGILGSALPVATLLVLGFGVKAGLVPLHSWLPLAHPVAPTAASALLSGAMVKAGLLGWLRLLPEDLALPILGTTLAVAGLLGAFAGVLLGLPHKDPKTVLAYSTVSQMGYPTLGLGLLLVSPHAAPLLLPAIAAYALHHGVAKGALFLSVGVGDRWAAAGGKGRTRALLWGAALPGAALAGAPFTSGALAKGLLKEGVSEVGGGWYAILDPLLVVAATGTVLLIVRFLLRLERRVARARTEQDGEVGSAASCSGSRILRPWVLLVGIGAGGMFWLPAVIGELPAGALPSPTAGLLSLLLPLGIGGGVAAWVLRRRDGTSGGGWPAPPAGDLVVPLEWGWEWVSRGLRRTGRRIGAAVARVGPGQGVAGRLARWADALVARDLHVMRGLRLGGIILGLVAVLVVALLG